MDNNFTVVLELLSAGVVAALVAGIFSLVIAIKNNKRLVELEKNKQKFSINQERYKGLREAYAELLIALPQEKRLGHIIMNSSSQENMISGVFAIADVNMKTMYSHFQKYGYLFSDDEQKAITDIIKEIDTIAESIIEISINSQGYDTEDGEDVLEEKIYKKSWERILKVVECEEMYYNLFKNDLSKLSK